MIAIITLILLLYMSLLATRFAAIILVYTGLSQKVAHFQARSALTGTGFSTKESEMIMAHPVRRKVILTLMLFGNVGVVAVFATFVIGFLKVGDAHDWIKVVTLVASLIGLWVLANSKTFEKWLDQVLSRFIAKRTEGANLDLEHLVHLGGDYKVASISLSENSPMLGKTVHQSFKGIGGLRLLGIERPGGKYIGAPSIEEVLKKDDCLIIYGLSDKIAEISRAFSPPAPEATPPATPDPAKSHQVKKTN